MRLFKRKPKKCNILSFTYDCNKPERGVQICLGVGRDKKLPNLPEREVAYFHLGFEVLEEVINELREIQNEFTKHSD